MDKDNQTHKNFSFTFYFVFVWEEISPFMSADMTYNSLLEV